MTEAQLKALILTNAALQITQLTAIYNAINSGTAQQVSDARAALQKTKDLESVLWEGVAAIRKHAQFTAEFSLP